MGGQEVTGLSDDIGSSSPRLMRAGGAGASPAGRGLLPESGRDKLLKECLLILGLCLPCLLAPIPPTSAPRAPETSERWSLGYLVPKAERESASQAFARACNPSMGPTTWRRLTTAAADPVCGLAMYFSAVAVRELEVDSWDGGWVQSSPLGAMLQVVAALAGALAAREGLPPLPHADHRVPVKREGGGCPPLKSPGVRVLQYLRTFYSRLLLRHKHGLAAAGQGHLVFRVLDRLALRSGAGSNGGGKGDPLWELPERESLGPLVEFVEVVAARSRPEGKPVQDPEDQVALSRGSETVFVPQQQSGVERPQVLQDPDARRFERGSSTPFPLHWDSMVGMRQGRQALPSRQRPCQSSHDLEHRPQRGALDPTPIPAVNLEFSHSNGGEVHCKAAHRVCGGRRQAPPGGRSHAWVARSGEGLARRLPFSFGDKVAQGPTLRCLGRSGRGSGRDGCQ